MRGFTLSEMMMVIGITALLVTMSLPLYNYFQTLNVDLSVKQELVEDLRLVETEAQQSLNDDSFGIYLTSATNYTIYQGATYLSRDQSKDITRILPTNTTVSGFTEIHFQKKTGLPTAPATITITNTTNTIQKNISINSQGLIQ